MTREEAIKIYMAAKLIFWGSRGKETRKQAKAIAVAIEKYIGQLDRHPAVEWEV